MFLKSTKNFILGGKLIGKRCSSWHKGKITYDKWREASYGISRLEGMLQSWNLEDWSVRLPETKEFLERCDPTTWN